MGKHDRCVIGVCNNDKRYPERMEVHSNVASGKIVMHKLPSDPNRSKAWIHHISKGRLLFQKIVMFAPITLWMANQLKSIQTQLYF